ncbi:ankyrin repeat domain-containing protein [Streptomyces luteolus]|uniref:Ankyrin repeat domain-containing protein n=1 Tax=Streptomyces luteolus TaxID=3043615 RepID=A0ABT6SSE1_9ACTN|nr:ankyrin repeat domain-containing protein [Streptomyces sp. B-S-A12]MDI3418521.1 ankyrin repeat domain-containing protein [Streptomyces sp. B-S-A12]
MSAQLIAAVRRGETAEAEKLLAGGADASTRETTTGLTVLMIAAGQADAPTVRELIRGGADVHTADRRAGATALHKACQGGSLEVVRALVEAGSFVDAVAPTTGHTALMDALWYKYPDIAEYLLGQGASLKVYTHYGFSLEQHFEYELNVNTFGKDKLLEAERHLNARRERDAAAVARQQLMAATAEGNTELAGKLLADGAKVDERSPDLGSFNDSHTPLLVAARDGHAEIVRLLLDAGADVNAVEPTFGAVPLHKAVYNGHAGITADLVRQDGTDLDFQGATNGYTPLHDSLWHGYEECARTLVEAGARLDLVGHDGKTPLDLAVEVFGAEHSLTGLIRDRAAA